MKFGIRAEVHTLTLSANPTEQFRLQIALVPISSALLCMILPCDTKGGFFVPCSDGLNSGSDAWRLTFASPS